MFWQAQLLGAQLLLGELTRHRPKRVSWEEFIQNNQPSEVRNIAYIGGTMEVTPPRMWFGDYKIRAVERDSLWTDYIWLGPLAFLLDAITVGYRYYLGEVFPLCWGENRHVQRVTIDDRPMYQAGLEFDNAGSGFLINDPEAWGGDQPPGEGGQYSFCRVTRGNYTDSTDTYLEQMLATPPNKCPSLRGVSTLISYGPSGPVEESGYFAAGGDGFIPKPRLWKVTVRAQPDNLATGFNKIGRHMNPMETIYEWTTSLEYGARTPLDELNLDNWRELAETLHGEGNGWSGLIEGTTSPGEVIDDVLAQIDAVRWISPSLGLGFRLIRRDYSFGSLRILDKSVITGIKEFTPGTLDDTINKVNVEYPQEQDNNFKPRKALYIDPANQQMQPGQRVIPQTVGFKGVADFEQAQVIATRLGRAQSLPRAPLDCTVFPSWGRLTYQGEVVRFQWSSPSIEIVMRVLKVTPNGPDERDYHLSLIEDQFSTGLRTFSNPGPSAHTDPAAGLSVAPPSATWNEAEFPEDGLTFTLLTANTNEFIATITGGVIFGEYAPGGQYARVYVTEPEGVQTLSPLRLAPDANNEATFTWPALAAGVYEFCVQTFSLRDATNGVKVCAEIPIAAIGSPSPSPSASVSPSASGSPTPSASASFSPSASLSPSASQSQSASISPSSSQSPSSSASPSAPEGPSGISDLQLWYDALQETGFSDDDEISTVQDWSGNNRDGTGVVGNVLKPTYRATDGPNGTPCFRMSEIGALEGGYFSVPDFLTSYTEGHAFVVVKLDQEPDVNSRAGPPLGDWGSNAVGEFYGFPADAGNYDGFGSSVRHTTGVQATARTNWLVYENRTASAVWSRRINGATTGNDLFSTGTNTVGWNTIAKVGARTSSGQALLYGLIAEVVFYNRVLDAGEITAIYDYLEAKYGITLP